MTVTFGGRRPTLALLLSAVALGACSSDGGRAPTPGEADDLQFVGDGSDTAAAETDAQLISSSLVSSSDLDGRDLGDAARASYVPQGCLVVSLEPATKTITYTFDNCLGPNGLRGVSGVVTAEYDFDAVERRLHLELRATNVAVNRAKVDWTATANITSQGGGARTMTWKATLSGTSAGGRTLERTTDHSIAWRLGEPCFALEGSSEGRVNDRHIRTKIERFRRCRRACPDAGGTITVTNLDTSATVELRYDGTNEAIFRDPSGRDVIVPLLCGS